MTTVTNAPQNQEQFAIFVLSAAEVNASKDTPITLFSSPGTNAFIQITKAKWVYRATATTSTTASGVSSIDCNGATLQSQSLASLTNSTQFFKFGQASSNGTNVNHAVTFKTASANPTIYGTLELHIWYTVDGLTQLT